jgi:hypothetical protein
MRAAAEAEILQVVVVEVPEAQVAAVQVRLLMVAPEILVQMV